MCVQMGCTTVDVIALDGQAHWKRPLPPFPKRTAFPIFVFAPAPILYAVTFASASVSELQVNSWPVKKLYGYWNLEYRRDKFTSRVYGTQMLILRD